MEWSRAKANRVFPRECSGHSKHPLPTAQENTLHMDITRSSVLKLDWLYSLWPKMEKLYTSAKTRPGADCGSDHELLIAKFRLKLKKAGKTIPLTRRTLVDKVMSLLLNILSRLVITFLSRSKHLLISWLKLYTVSKNKTRSWLWLGPWTSYCQIQTEIEENGENHWTIQVWPKSNTYSGSEK